MQEELNLAKIPANQEWHYTEYDPFDLLYTKPYGVLMIHKDARTKYYLENKHKKSMQIKKFLAKEFKNVWFGKDNENELYIVVDIAGRVVKCEAKADRVFFFPNDDMKELTTKTLIDIYGENKVSLKGENDIIELIIDL